MHQSLRIAPLLIALAPYVSAQVTLLEEDFDTDLSAWQSEHQWHWEVPRPLACPSSSSGESPQGGGAARWGTGCTFMGVEEGSLTLAEPVSIPPTADDPRLRFLSYADSEACFADMYGIWDVHYVEVSSNGGASWDELARHCSGAGVGQWVEFDLSLMAYRGQDLLLRFRFNAFDPVLNGGFGWVIDDVSITTATCGAFTYCDSTANSAFPTGAITGQSGSLRIGNNDFFLTVDDAPPAQFGYFFYGPDPRMVTVADGIHCVAGGNLGIRRMPPAGMTDAQGHYERHLDFPSTLNTPLAIVPGSQWRFQFWFRDPAGGPGGSNFSSGLAVTFCN